MALILSAVEEGSSHPAKKPGGCLKKVFVGLLLVLAVLVVGALLIPKEAPEQAVSAPAEPEPQASAAAEPAEADAASPPAAPEPTPEKQPEAVVPAVAEPTFPFTTEAFLKSYNAFAANNHIPVLPAKPGKRQDGPKATVSTYMASQNVAVQFQYPPKSEAVKGLIFIGAGDGSEKSGLAMVMGALAFINALTPELSDAARQEALSDLGLTPLKVQDGKSRSWQGNGMEITSLYSEMTGLMIGASPAPAQADAAAPAPASETQPAAKNDMPLPKYDTKAYCKSVGEAAGGSSEIELYCRKEEEAAKARIATIGASAKAMKYCDEVGKAAGGSYEILESCLKEEMEAAKQLGE